MATATNEKSKVREDSMIPHAENYSFLCPRDPSILAFHQRPLIKEGKNLEYLLSNVDDIPPETVKVYLRMKPFPANQVLTEEQHEAYRILNKTTLLTKLPNVDNNVTQLKKFKSNEIVCKKYIFTQTFGPETSQITIFEESIKPQLIEFIKGVKNSVVMTYGTTNSGKSYTLRGTTASPGIIPRSLEFVFTNINEPTKLRFKPVYHSDVIMLDNSTAVQELSSKDGLLTFNNSDKNKYINNYKDMQKTLHEESFSSVTQDDGAEYSVWVSFAEIYNEVIYDLLITDYQKRPSLKLGTDSKGRLFIKDLKMVNVSSGTEAYQVFMSGQHNLKIAATALNTRSSRSHCIFTIKLLKYHNGDDAENVQVSTFTFCDLAGSERLNKTLNVGDRLKEAQNINTSLLVLSRCLKSIYEHQTSNSGKKKNEIVGPFRESKLTRLFQSALSGKEHIALIVNINPAPTLYIETQNVLKFSAIAKKIVQENKPQVKPKFRRTRFSQAIANSLKTETDWDDAPSCASEIQEEESTSFYIDEEEYLDLINEIKELKKKLAKTQREAIERDINTREEITEMFQEMMDKMESEYRKQLSDQEANHEEYLQWREKMLEDDFEQQLESYKQRRSSIMVNNEDANMLEINKELQAENEQLNSKIESLKEKVRKHKGKNNELSNEKNMIEHQLKEVQNELTRCKQLIDAQDEGKHSENSEYIDELKAQLAQFEERSKNYTKLLNDAKQEYLALSEDLKVMEKRMANKDEETRSCYDCISDLEEQLEVVNTCSAEKNVEIENYETRVEQLTKQIIQKDILIDSLKKDISGFEETLNLSCKKNEELSHELEQKVFQLELLKEELENNRFEILKNSQTVVEKVSFSCQTEAYVDFEVTQKLKLLEEDNDKYLETICNLTKEVEQLNSQIKSNTDKNKLKEEKIEKLEQEIKKVLNSTSSQEAVAEMQLKNTLRELTSTKEELDKYKQKKLELQKTIEFNQRQSAVLQTNKDELIRENERLKITNEKLENERSQTQRDLEAFKKNRDIALGRYEELTVAQSAEISRLKDLLEKEHQEVKELHKKCIQQASHQNKSKKNVSETSEEEVLPSKSKKRVVKTDSTEVLSEDEVVPEKRSNSQRKVKKFPIDFNAEEVTRSANRRMTRQTAIKRELAPLTPSSVNTDDINIIDVSSTDSKYPKKALSLAPPQSIETKRTRRKQLFKPEDDMVDIENNQENIDLCESIPPSPSYNTRSTRKRRK